MAETPAVVVGGWRVEVWKASDVLEALKDTAHTQQAEQLLDLDLEKKYIYFYYNFLIVALAAAGGLTQEMSKEIFIKKDMLSVIDMKKKMNI